MKITRELISENLKKCDNLLDKLLLLNLYREYTSFDKMLNDNKIKYKNDFKISDLNIACDKIINEIDSKKNSSVYSRVEISEQINSYVILLLHCLRNYKIADKQKSKELIDIITVLEGYLCVPLSFPQNAEHCLYETLERLNMEVKRK